jgi:hypothetical protein
MSSELWLMIEDCKCGCGFQWTHSRIRHINGGTPDPATEAQGRCVGYNVVPVSTSFCSRCVPTLLGPDWTPPDPGPSKGPTLEDIRNELLNV